MSNACGYPFDDAGLSLLLEHGLGRRSGGPWRALLDHRLHTPAQMVQRELRNAAQWNLPNRARLLLRRDRHRHQRHLRGTRPRCL